MKTNIRTAVPIRNLTPLFLVAAFLLPAGMLPAADSSPFLDLLSRVLPRHDIQVITVSDLTPQGKNLPPVSASNPVYYIAVNAGYGDFGGIVAGITPPPQRTINRAITKVLAGQNYFLASDEHPATQVIFWTWGTMNSEFFDINGPQLNLIQKLRFIGGRKVGLLAPQPFNNRDELADGLFLLDPNARTFFEAATDDLYVASLSGYECEAMRRGEKKLLWTTRISCPSLGLELGETLPVMLNIAGPYIARETPQPVWINATDKYKATVQIGELQVLGVADDHAPAIINAPELRAKAMPSQFPR